MCLVEVRVYFNWIYKEDAKDPDDSKERIWHLGKARTRQNLFVSGVPTKPHLLGIASPKRTGRMAS